MGGGTLQSYGVQPLLEITVTRNRQVKQIYATDEHRWFVRSGKNQRSRAEKVTRTLKKGDRLVPVFPRSRVGRTTPSPFGIAHGFTYGDGTRSGTGSMALLCPPKDLAMLKWFPNSHTTASGDNLLVHHLPRFFKELPDFDESVSYLYGWLAGYFAADGCVAADGTVILNSAHRSDLEFVRTVATRLGIATYGITDQVREGFEAASRATIYRDPLSSTRTSARTSSCSGSPLAFRVQPEAVLRDVDGWSDRLSNPTVWRRSSARRSRTGTRLSLGRQHPDRQLFRLSGRRRRHHLRDEDRRPAPSPRSSSGSRRSTASSLRCEEGEPGRTARGGPQRPRLIEAHRVAAAYYVDRWPRPRRVAARQFLGRARVRPGGGGQFGVGLLPARRRGPATPPPARGFGDEETGRVRPDRVGRVGIRPLPRPPDLADPRHQRRHHRLRRPADLRRRPDRGEVPQHPRDADLQEEPGALRHRPRPPRHRPLHAGRGGRGLHRRDGVPPVRRDRPRSPRAARRSATTTRACCAGFLTTTRSSAAR